MTVGVFSEGMTGPLPGHPPLELPWHVRLGGYLRQADGKQASACVRSMRRRGVMADSLLLVFSVGLFTLLT